MRRSNVGFYSAMSKAVLALGLGYKERDTGLGNVERSIKEREGKCGARLSWAGAPTFKSKHQTSKCPERQEAWSCHGCCRNLGMLCLESQTGVVSRLCTSPPHQQHPEWEEASLSQQHHHG